MGFSHDQTRLSSVQEKHDAKHRRHKHPLVPRLVNNTISPQRHEGHKGRRTHTTYHEPPSLALTSSIPRPRDYNVFSPEILRGKCFHFRRCSHASQLWRTSRTSDTLRSFTRNYLRTSALICGSSVSSLCAFASLREIFYSCVFVSIRD